MTPVTKHQTSILLQSTTCKFERITRNRWRHCTLSHNVLIKSKDSTIILHLVQHVNAALLLFWIMHKLDLPASPWYHFLFRKEVQYLLVGVQVPVDSKFPHSIQRSIDELHMASVIDTVLFCVVGQSGLEGLLVAFFLTNLIKYVALLHNQFFWFFLVILISDIQETKQDSTAMHISLSLVGSKPTWNWGPHANLCIAGQGLWSLTQGWYRQSTAVLVDRTGVSYTQNKSCQSRHHSRHTTDLLVYLVGGLRKSPGNPHHWRTDNRIKADLKR